MLLIRSLIFLLLAATLGIAQDSASTKSLDPAPSSSTKPSDHASTKTKPSASAIAKPAEATASDKPTTLSQQQIRDLIRLCAENDLKNDKLLRDYTYVERQVTRHVDGKGQVKSTETKTYDELQIYGEPVEKLIAKDDKPLSAKDAQKEDEKIQKLIDKRKDESDADRQKRLEKEEKDREEERQFVREVADAFNFKFVGIEQLDGRDNYVIDGDPKPGYQPVHREAKILPKLRFRVWIDRTDSQVAKVDAEMIDTASFGLFLARLHKGSRILIEQARVNDEVWLQKHVTVKMDARIALLKDFNVDMDITDRDYKKFRTETKIVGVGEMPSQ